MTRLFLPDEVRESLLATGRATWRKRVEPQPLMSTLTDKLRLWASEDAEIVCPTPPGREYWVPETWQCCRGCNPGNGVIYRMGWRWVAAHPWRSPAEMPSKYSRLHVRVASVRVVRNGEWWWEIELERIDNANPRT